MVEKVIAVAIVGEDECKPVWLFAFGTFDFKIDVSTARLAQNFTYEYPQIEHD
jgi:hypothetical protein